MLYILCSFLTDSLYLHAKVLVEKMGLPEGYDSSSVETNGDVLRKFLTAIIVLFYFLCNLMLTCL